MYYAPHKTHAGPDVVIIILNFYFCYSIDSPRHTFTHIWITGHKIFWDDLKKSELHFLFIFPYTFGIYIIPSQK